MVKGPPSYDNYTRITVTLAFSANSRVAPFITFKGKPSVGKINPVEREIAGYAFATVSPTGWAQTATCEQHMQAMVQKSSRQGPHARGGARGRHRPGPHGPRL